MPKKNRQMYVVTQYIVFEEDMKHDVLGVFSKKKDAKLFVHQLSFNIDNCYKKSFHFTIHEAPYKPIVVEN